ncbi:MAG: tRNA (guanosine(46)-N7)-methyltransferase TrmB [Henriciella sp.]
MSDLQHPALKSFGRRGGRPLSARQIHLMETLLPQRRVPLPDTGLLDPRDLRPGGGEVWFEIGFGGGEHPIGQALRRPDVTLLASEVFQEGLAKCLGLIDDHGVSNLFVWDEDARGLAERLCPASLDRVFILFPDPWPKARHRKRRLVQPDFLDLLARIVRPGGQVRFATDVRDYADEALVHFVNHTGFKWTAQKAHNWRERPMDHIATRYERKNIGDIAPVWYDFERC